MITKQFSYMLTRPVASHVRPADRLMKEVSRFSSSISVYDGETGAKLQKAGDLLKLNLSSGKTVTVIVDGKDEEAAVAAIQNYIVANF